MNKIEQFKSILKEEIPYLQKHFGIEEIGVFGSYIREEQKKGSDLDILVKFYADSSIGLFDLVALDEYLEKKLGVKVDVANKDTLKKYIGKRILAEVEYL